MGGRGWTEGQGGRHLCQFPWCKYSHHGQFHAINMMGLNTELERCTEAAPGDLAWRAGGRGAQQVSQGGGW